MSWLRRAAREQVVAHLSDGSSVRGFVAHARRDSLLLSPAAVLRADAPNIPVDGGALVPRESVVWLQKLPAETIAIETRPS